ncbi:hypothetical protein Q5752_006137 [Cryptotrichosporon argae]
MTQYWQERAPSKRAEQVTLIPPSLRLDPAPAPGVLNVTGYAGVEQAPANHARALASAGEPDLGLVLDSTTAHLLMLEYWAVVYIYCTAWCNLNDYATAVAPVTPVDPALDAKPPRDTFLSPADESNYRLYDAEFMKAAPIALQVVGRKYEEEAVIRVTEIVDAATKAARA